MLERDPGRRGEIKVEMRARVDKVLNIALEHEHTYLVLGAWGCGVFRNDPEEMAGLFHAALSGPFENAFEQVVFAVLDSTREQSTITPFRRRFSPVRTPALT